MIVLGNQEVHLVVMGTIRNEDYWAILLGKDKNKQDKVGSERELYICARLPTCIRLFNHSCNKFEKLTVIFDK